MTPHQHPTSAAPQFQSETIGPLLACWRSGHWDRADRYPDAVTDTTRRRAAGAARAMPHIRRVRRVAIAAGHGPKLIHFVMPLEGVLYSADDYTAARAAVLDAVGSLPVWYKLEGVAHVDLHLHGVTSAAAVPILEALGIWNTKVKGGTSRHLHRLARYLAKPQDARAVRHNFQREPVAPAAAAEDYLAAKQAAAQSGRKRLPNKVGTLNTPKDTHRRAKSPLAAVLVRLNAARAALEAVEQARRRRAAEWQAHSRRAALALTRRRAARAAVAALALQAFQPPRPITRPKAPAAVPLERYYSPDRAPPPHALRR